MSFDLLTGVPGTGKSNYLVSLLLFNKTYRGRDIYQHGIEELDVPRAMRIYCGADYCRSCSKVEASIKFGKRTVETVHEWAIPGDIIVVDEAQYPYPDRRHGAAPGFIQRLTESRHDGIDFIVITPNYSFVDVYIRKLVERQIHFVKGLKGRFTFTHVQCVTSDGQLMFGDKAPFKLDKRVFNKYKSADYHTVIDRQLPMAVKLARYMIGALVVAFCITAYQIKDSRQNVRDAVAASAPSTPSLDVPASSAKPLSRVDGLSRVTRLVANDHAFWSDDSNLDFRPRLREYPESAPAYDAFFEPVVPVPVLSGCISSASKCSCFTDSGSEYSTTERVCRAVASGDSSPRVVAASASGSANKPATRAPLLGP